MQKTWVGALKTKKKKKKRNAPKPCFPPKKVGGWDMEHGILITSLPETAKIEIETTFAVQSIKMGDIQKLRANLLEKAGKLLESRVASRCFKAQYRGVEIELTAPTLAAEIDLRIACAIKSAAPDPDLVQLHFEDAVFGSVKHQTTP